MAGLENSHMPARSSFQTVEARGLRNNSYCTDFEGGAGQVPSNCPGLHNCPLAPGDALGRACMTSSLAAGELPRSAAV